MTLTAAALLVTVAATANWTPPEALADKLASLDAAQAEFLTSGAVLDYISERQLEHELANRDSESMALLIDDLMALAEQMTYDPARDMGAIPLNLASRRFGMSPPTPEPLRKHERQPGPFGVHRYQVPHSGVPTFAGAKVAIFPEDLVAGDVDVAIVGIPSNMSSGRRDAASGPNAMRALPTIALPDARTLLQPLEVLSVVDYGNFATDNLSAERTVAHVTAMVTETAATGAVPMLVGGDTSMLYPGVKGVAQASEQAFGLVHFSAHPDASRTDDHTISDNQSIFALIDEGVVDGADTVLFGLRSAAVDSETLRWLRDQGVRYHTGVEISDRGFDRVLKKTLSEVERGPDRYFVSVDVSVLRPADMPAAGRIAPDGLDAPAVTEAIRHVCASKQIAGFEITDLAPVLDRNRVSVLHANALLNACLNGMAVRRAGMAPDDVHPLVAGHGQR